MNTNPIVFGVFAGWIAVFVPGTLTPTPAYAAPILGPILAFDPVRITLTTTACCEAGARVVQDSQSHFVPIEDAALFFSFSEIPGSRFPTRLAPDQPFASAVATQDGLLHAGGSGIVFNQAHFMDAEITYQTSVTNVGDAPARLVVDYTFAPMEVSFVSGRGITGPSATVRATADRTLTLQDGTILPATELFFYEMLLIDDDFSTGFTRISPDVLRDFGSPEFFTDGELIRYSTPERSFSIDVGLLAPRESMLVSYHVEVSTDTGGASEVGMQALFGDPLSLSAPGAGGFSLSLASPALVPEPATSALVAVGLAMAVLLRRWARSRARSSRN